MYAAINLYLGMKDARKKLALHPAASEVQVLKII
jgi:hypothetical protein